MANKTLGTRQKLMFRGTAGVGGRVGARYTEGRPPPPAPGAPGVPGRRPGSVGIGNGREVGGVGEVGGRRTGGGGAVDSHTGRKQRRAKTGGA